VLDQPRIIRRALGRAQQALPAAGRVARRRREQQYWQWQQRRHRNGGDTMEATARAMYAGPGFTAAAPERSMLPMPTAFLVPVA